MGELPAALENGSNSEGTNAKTKADGDQKHACADSEIDHRLGAVGHPTTTQTPSAIVSRMTTNFTPASSFAVRM